MNEKVTRDAEFNIFKINDKMKRVNDYQVGDCVYIVGIDELEIIMQCYINTEIAASMKSIDLCKIAGRRAQIVHIPKTFDDLKRWDGNIGVVLEDGMELFLPFAVISDGEPESQPKATEEDLMYIVDEGDSEPMLVKLDRASSMEERQSNMDSNDPQIVRHRNSELEMIHLLAAETIQDAFR